MLKSFFSKKISSSLILFSLFLPMVSYAQFGGITNTLFGALNVEYGGYVTFVTPCTCTPGNFLITYIPPYKTTHPWVTRSLVLTPGATRYPERQYLIVPAVTSWHLGKFAPVPNTPVCLVGIPPACVPVFNDGVITELGSSAPGFPPPVGF